MTLRKEEEEEKKLNNNNDSIIGVTWEIIQQRAEKTLREKKNYVNGDVTAYVIIHWSQCVERKKNYMYGNKRTEVLTKAK